MSIPLTDQVESERRFFTRRATFARRGTSKTLEQDIQGLEEIEDYGDAGWNDDEQSCATRYLQQCNPFVKKDIWDASHTDLYQTKIIEEAKYPRILLILQSFYVELIFVLSSLFSVALLFFSEAFLLESRFLWGIILLNNAVYNSFMFAAWFEVLITSKFSLTKRGFSKWGLLMDVISVMPLDFMFFVMYELNESPYDAKQNEIVNWLRLISRLNYFFRLRKVSLYMSKWEKEVTVGEFKLLFLKLVLYSFFLVHVFACLWHRVACKPFREGHLYLPKRVAIKDCCDENSWVQRLIEGVGEGFRTRNGNPSPVPTENIRSPLFSHDGWNIVLEHYLASMYYGFQSLLVLDPCGLGYVGDVLVSGFKTPWEILLNSITQIPVFIFIAVFIAASVTAILIQSETKNETFLNRRVSITRYLNFNEISDEVKSRVNRFYDYLWARNKGFLVSNMMDQMPLSLRAEIFYDINKFVLDQLPLFVNLDEAFLMSLGVYVKHKLLMKGEVVQRKGEIGNVMYFVINGFLEVLHGDGTNVLIEVRSGSVIGELLLLYPFPIAATLRAGTECDVMVLHREDCTKVLRKYPKNKAIIKKRFDERLEQSSLLLSVCGRYNQYAKAFNKLCHPMVPENEDDNGCFKQSYEDNGFSSQPLGIDKPGRSEMSITIQESRQGLSLERHCRRLRSNTKDISAVSFAVEKDLTRASGLASDLDMPKPPLFVRATKSFVHKKTVTVSEEKTPFAFIHLSSNIIVSGLSHSEAWKIWKFLVQLSVNFAFIYHPYRMSFGASEKTTLDHFSHVFDLIFLIDFLTDMSRPVVLPHRTLEHPGDICCHHVHTLYFWIRLFAFLPIEYPLDKIVGETHHLFFVFRINRLLTYPEGLKFYTLFKDSDLISQKFLFLFRFFLRLFHMVHLFAILSNAVLKFLTNFCDENKPGPKINCVRIKDYPGDYDHYFYFAMQTVTPTNFVDVYLVENVVVLVVAGLVFGVAWIMYLSAKLTSITANEDKGKIMFKQLYYSVQTLLKDRCIPDGLALRVVGYYKLQWYQNRGVLLPQGAGKHSAIWDAPRGIVGTVALAQAKDYVESIPLFQHSGVIGDICTALRLYTVPPSEILQNPNSCTRELYIIDKGYCKVTRSDKLIGELGPGNYFGLSGLIYGMNPHLHIETVNSCQIFCLEFNKFLEIAQRHAEFMEEFTFLRGDSSIIPDNFSTQLDPAELEIFNLLRSNEVTPQPFVPSVTEVDPEQPEVPSSVAGIKSRLHSVFLGPILPYGTALKWWILFRTFCAFFIANFVCKQAAFPDNPKISLFTILTFDILAWFDMLICTRVAYYGPDNQLITSFKKTAVHYLKGPFILDFLGSFPMDLLIILFDPKIHLFGPNPTYNDRCALISLIRWTRLIQCYRLFVFGRYTDTGIFKSLSRVVLLQVAPLMALIINIIACASFLAACGLSHNGEIITCDSEPTAWIHNVKGDFFTNAPYSPYTLMRDHSVTSYIVAIYWTLSYCLCVGFGDLFTNGQNESRNAAITAIFLGVGLTYFVISKVSACRMAEDPRRTKVREMTKAMSKFLDDYGIPDNLRRRAQEYCNGAWDKTKGIYPTDLIQALHPNLRFEVMKALYEERLRQSPVFSTLDEPGIFMLCTMLQEVFYPEGEFLFEYGDLCEDVYFITKGLSATYTDRGMITSYVGNGSLIGEISCLLGIQRQYTAVASTDSEIYMFRKPDFMKFLSLYPDIKTTVEQSCVHHFKETLHTSSWEHLNGSDSGSNGSIPESIEDEEDDEIHLIMDMEHILDFEDLANHVAKYDDILLRRHNTPTQRTKPRKSSVAILEMDLGSATELTPAECDNIPGFVEDPLRIVPSESEIPKSRGWMSSGSSDKHHRRHGQRKRWWYDLLKAPISYGNVPMDEMGLIHIVQERDKVRWCLGGFTIHPLSPLCTWVSLYLLITTLSCAFTAFETAFHHLQEDFLVARIPIEVFFAIKMFGNFFQGYYDEKGRLVTNTKLITKRYLSKGFILDFITLFPFYLIGHAITGGREDVEVVFRHLRSLQLLRIFLLAHYLRKVETQLRMKLTRIKIIKVGILLFFIFHFSACGWYVIACNGLKCRTGSWMNILISEFTGDQRIRNGSEDLKAGARYLLSLSYVTTAITFNGLADITARTEVELVMTIGIIFFSVFLLAFVVGEITQCISSQLKSKIHFRLKLDQLANHFRSLNLSPSKMEMVRKYFQVFWRRTNAQPFTKLLEELPYPLRADITYNIYGNTIHNSRVFANLHRTIVRQLSTRVKHEIYLPGSHIVKSGHICNAIYFIMKGEVVIIDDNGGMDLCVDVLHENECFGEVKVLLPIKEGFHFSYAARLETEIGILSADDVMDVLGRHKFVLQEYINRAVLLSDQDAQRKDEDDTTLQRLIDFTSKHGGEIKSKNLGGEATQSYLRFRSPSPSEVRENFTTGLGSSTTTLESTANESRTTPTKVAATAFDDTTPPEPNDDIENFSLA